ncbi:hypothetical protein EVAR_4467_1 [Eumeta japonica]|uniref:Uncharacterized protein n=1 Tax=Eumeta variegata TaxID=151549 RepID=A0A4C1T1B7_EUMVA|nr:hypothetical protein EVAR_4467_1 [Eumeta japonica]
MLRRSPAPLGLRDSPWRRELSYLRSGGVLYEPSPAVTESDGAVAQYDSAVKAMPNRSTTLRRQAYLGTSPLHCNPVTFLQMRECYAVAQRWKSDPIAAIQIKNILLLYFKFNDQEHGFRFRSPHAGDGRQAFSRLASAANERVAPRRGGVAAPPSALDPQTF